MIIRVTSSSLSQSLISEFFRSKPLHFPSPSIVRAQQDSAADKPNTSQTKTEESSNAQPPTTALKTPKKSVYSMKKGQIVRVDKEKYLNSINYLSVGHPTYYKGLDYIYEDRGEVLDMRIFETGICTYRMGRNPHCSSLASYRHAYQEKLNYERL